MRDVRRANLLMMKFFSTGEKTKYHLERRIVFKFDSLLPIEIIYFCQHIQLELPVFFGVKS